jgi:hypothetical protein
MDARNDLRGTEECLEVANALFYAGDTSDAGPSVLTSQLALRLTHVEVAEWSKAAVC